jgi:hypothetical protein
VIKKIPRFDRGLVCAFSLDMKTTPPIKLGGGRYGDAGKSVYISLKNIIKEACLVSRKNYKFSKNSNFIYKSKLANKRNGRREKYLEEMSLKRSDDIQEGELLTLLDIGI